MASDIRQFADFRLLAELGRGSGSVVYKALDTRSDRLVALKLPRYSPEMDYAERNARLLREAQVCAILCRNARIIAVYEVNMDPIYVVREFVEGQSLAMTARIQSFNWRQALTLMLEVAEAVGFTHQSGLAHRNLDPTNVLVTLEGKVKLIGFGRCCPLDPDLLIDKSDFRALDAYALHDMVIWLAKSLETPLPAPLAERLSDVSKLADRLRECLKN